MGASWLLFIFSKLKSCHTLHPPNPLFRSPRAPLPFQPCSHLWHQTPGLSLAPLLYCLLHNRKSRPNASLLLRLSDLLLFLILPNSLQISFSSLSFGHVFCGFSRVQPTCRPLLASLVMGRMLRSSRYLSRETLQGYAVPRGKRHVFAYHLQYRTRSCCLHSAASGPHLPHQKCHY
jgi:hypothetical protein